MKFNRRQFMMSAAAVAASTHPAFPAVARQSPDRSPTLPASKEQFPWAATETFINSAAYHPMSVASARAMEAYIAYRLKGPGEGRDDFGGGEQEEVKTLFARLINAKPSEIAFVQSTSDGENIVIAGMDLLRSGGNVVIDDLHYNSSLYIYKMLQQAGLEVRIVRQKDWAIDLKDVERAVDKNTKLVSMALVSNVNGYLHDVKGISDIAHASGAYVYADVIQAAGAVPIDVAAMGLDMCACSSYKWLMGDRGFGFLYIREDLQGRVVRHTRYGHRQYSGFTRPTAANPDIQFKSRSGGSLYETGNIPNVIAAAMREALRYIVALGVPRIRAHAKPLTDRLQKELPPMGYASITPRDTPTPIVTVLLKDPAQTRARLEKANIAVTIVSGNQMRISPSVFNTQEDISKLLGALAS
jgi:selenocysteine lyase/cysteine desulfurase